MIDVTATEQRDQKPGVNDCACRHNLSTSGTFYAVRSPCVVAHRPNRSHRRWHPAPPPAREPNSMGPTGARVPRRTLKVYDGATPPRSGQQAVQAIEQSMVSLRYRITPSPAMQY